MAEAAATDIRSRRKVARRIAAAVSRRPSRAGSAIAGVAGGARSARRARGVAAAAEDGEAAEARGPRPAARRRAAARARSGRSALAAGVAGTMSRRRSTRRPRHRARVEPLAIFSARPRAASRRSAPGSHADRCASSESTRPRPRADPAADVAAGCDGSLWLLRRRRRRAPWRREVASGFRRRSSERIGRCRRDRIRAGARACAAGRAASRVLASPRRPCQREVGLISFPPRAVLIMTSTADVALVVRIARAGRS